MMRKDMTLAEAIGENPRLVDVFNRMGIDYCCGGHDTLEEAARKKREDPDRLLVLLEEELGKPQETKEVEIRLEAFEKRSVPEMIASLMETHHKRERELFEKITQDLNKILLVHYEAHSDLLIPLHNLYGSLRIELEEHFAKEERLIFPMILGEKDGDRHNALRELESEHEAAGEMIKEMQALTDDFTLPEGVCPTFRRTYGELQELVEDVFLHIYKENSLLFEKVKKEMEE